MQRSEFDKVLLQADSAAALLELYDLNLVCFKDDEEYVKPNTQEMIRILREKLNRFLSNFLDNLKQSFIDLKKEVPSELHFL